MTRLVAPAHGARSVVEAPEKRQHRSSDKMNEPIGTAHAQAAILIGGRS
jgi:hypothetical protein